MTKALSVLMIPTKVFSGTVRSYMHTQSGWQNTIIRENITFTPLSPEHATHLEDTFRDCWEEHARTCSRDWDCANRQWPNN